MIDALLLGVIQEDVVDAPGKQGQLAALGPDRNSFVRLRKGLLFVLGREFLLSPGR